MAAEFGAAASCCACVSVLVTIYKEKELKDMIQFDQKSGFVAGTLVHTDKGLVAVDQLKVGDMVLSRLKNDPDEPNEYKRVLRTIKSATKQPLSYVQYMVNIDGLNKDDGNRYVFCTANYPLFINKLNYHSDTNSSSLAKRLGWIAAERLGTPEYDEAIETLHQDKAFATVWPQYDYTGRFLRKQGNTFAIATTDEDGSGPLFDFRHGRPIALGGGGVSMGTLSCSLAMDGMSPEQEQIIYPPSDDDPHVQAFLPMLRNGSWDDYEDYVYNIEIENYHTYFVDKIGIWVHDASANIS